MNRLIRLGQALGVSSALLAASTGFGGVAGASPAGPLAFQPSGWSSHPTCTTPTAPKEVGLTAADGTALMTLLYQPQACDDPDWRPPVILADSDYFEGNGYPAYGDLAQFLVDRYVREGYAVVKLESRGSGRSGGCHDDFGPASGTDFKQAVEYYASLPWTNGRVGSWGGSADGTYQNEGSVLAPKGLVTTVVMNAVSSQYDEHAFDGVPYNDVSGNGSLEYEFQTAGSNAASSDALVGEVADRAPCRAERSPDAMGPYVDGTETPYYVDRDYRRHVADISASVLYVASLHDTVVPPIAIDGWYDRIPTFKRAVFTQLDHEPVFDTHTKATDATRVPIMRHDWWAMFDAWFDYWLLRKPTGVAKWPAVQVQDDHNVWRAVPSFTGMGSLRSEPLGAGVLGTAALAGTTETFGEGRPQTWEMPVTSDLHLSGQAHVDAPLTIDSTNAHFMMSLQSIGADGTATTLTRGYLAANHRTSLTSSNVVLPTATYSIRTQPFDAWVPKGSTLRLTLSGTDPVPVNETTTSGGGYTAMPAGTGFTATLPVDGRSVLQLPISDDSCGLVVEQDAPSAVIPVCANPAAVIPQDPAPRDGAWTAG